MSRRCAKTVTAVLKSRSVLLLVACMVVLGSVAGGTVAWLIGEASPITNVFTPGNISITLSETDTNDGDNDATTNTYKLLPSATIQKDPLVSVLANSENCYLFVKLEKSANFDSFMTYELADGWTALQDVENVYYRTVYTSDAVQSFGVLKDDAVVVLPTVTALMLNSLTVETFPTLTVSAYAVQVEGFALPADAWALVTN